MTGDHRDLGTGGSQEDDFFHTFVVTNLDEKQKSISFFKDSPFSV